MAGFSPEAVLRTLSGLQVVQGGCESVAPVDELYDQFRITLDDMKPEYVG
ncbi:hypothetical protein ACYT45_18250 [Klebsiella variicola]